MNNKEQNNIEIMKNVKTEKEVSISDLRNSLKGMMAKELKNLPDSLEKLEPVQRLNILCKLMPYVMPKVETVHYQQDEPDEPFW
jgi:hypothetical protein